MIHLTEFKQDLSRPLERPLKHAEKAERYYNPSEQTFVYTQQSPLSKLGRGQMENTPNDRDVQLHFCWATQGDSSGNSSDQTC